jgi:hypothetical protein
MKRGAQNGNENFNHRCAACAVRVRGKITPRAGLPECAKLVFSVRSASFFGPSVMGHKMATDRKEEGAERPPSPYQR